jgi:hypothetical protein
MERRGLQESVMSNVFFLKTNRVPGHRPALASRTPGTRVYVRETGAGIWLVHDDHDSKGGCFMDRAAAFRFAADEFGADAEIVIQPRFAPPSRRAVSHFKQSRSVAQKAVAR